MATTTRKIASADVTGALGYTPVASPLSNVDASQATVTPSTGGAAMTLASLAGEVAGAVQAVGGDVSAAVVKPTGSPNPRNVSDAFGDVLIGVAFGMDPSYATDSTAAFLAFVAAVQSTGKPGFIPAGKYNLTGPLVLDFSTARNLGCKIYGASKRQTRLVIANATTSPALQLQSTAGAVFYLEIEDLAINTTCSAPALAIGRNLGSPANGAANYPDAFNSCNFINLVVNNSANNPNSQGIQVNGLYQSDLLAVVNCYPGMGTSLRWNYGNFNRISGSYSTAHIGLYLSEFYAFSNLFQALDNEVCDIPIQIDSAYATENTFSGCQLVTNGAIPTFCLNATAGSQNRFIGCNAGVTGGATVFGSTVGVVWYGAGGIGTETLAGLNVGNLAISGTATAQTPTASGQVATKGYVDTKLAGASGLLDLSAGVPLIAAGNKIGLSGTTTITQSGTSNTILITDTGTYALALKGVSIPVPTSSPYRVAILLTHAGPLVDYIQIEVGWANAAGTAFDTLAITDALTLNHETWSSPTVRASYSGAGVYGKVGAQGLSFGTIALGFHFDGTNVIWESTSDLVSFSPILTVPVSSGYLGSTGYNNIFVGMAPQESQIQKLAIRLWDNNGLNRAYP